MLLGTRSRGLRPGLYAVARSARSFSLVLQNVVKDSRVGLFAVSLLVPFQRCRGLVHIRVRRVPGRNRGSSDPIDVPLEIARV